MVVKLKTGWTDHSSRLRLKSCSSMIPASRRPLIRSMNRQGIYNSNATNKSKDVYRQSADEFKMAIRIMEELLKRTNPTTCFRFIIMEKAIALSNILQGRNTGGIGLLNTYDIAPNSTMHIIQAQN